MGLQRIPYKDFAGGINLDLGPYDLESNEAQAAQNMRILTGNALDQRDGKTRFDTSGYPATKRVENMKAWNFASTKLMMCSIDGTVYSMSTGGVLTSRFAGTAGKTWCFQPAQNSAAADRLWFMNGTDAAKQWDGSGAVAAWGGTPPNGTMCIMWRNRMIVSGVAANPQRVFYSDIGNPESPSSGAYGSNWIDIKTTDDDIDPVTGLSVVGDVLVVFKKSSVWVVTDDSTFANHRLGQPGAINHYASAVLENRVYFFSVAGLYSTNGYDNLKFEGENLESYVPANMNFSVLDKVRVSSTSDRKILVAFPTTQTYNTELWEYYPFISNRRSDGRTVHPWMKHTLGVSSMATWTSGNAPVLYAGDSNDVKIHSLFTGTSDDGVAIDAYWISSWRAFFPEEPFERVRRVNVEMSGQCTVDIYADLSIATPTFSESIVSSNVTVDPLWDGGTWDGGVWTEDTSLASLERVRPEQRARYHAVGVRNNVLNKTFTIYGMEFAIRGGKEH